MWFRSKQVDILKYLPAFLQDDINFKSVADDCSGEHEKIRLVIQDIFNQFFIETATWGLSRYENILAIEPNKGDSYSQRRKRILLKLQSNQISTKEFITQLAKRYYSSAANVTLEEQNEKNAFRIVADVVSYDAAGLIEALETYKPAHLAYLIVYRINVLMQLYVSGLVRKYKKIVIKTCVDLTVIENMSASIGATGIVKISRKRKIRSWE
jgi:uncharacterized protein YmfQ (DUF2313 family)